MVVAKREIDFLTAPALVAELDRAINEGDGKVVVDLCDVTFMDSSGAHALLEASKRLGGSGLREAMRLLAQAELDLRGASGLDERTVMDVLIARLAALSRRAGRR